jgi:hypothetical protein
MEPQTLNETVTIDPTEQEVAELEPNLDFVGIHEIVRVINEYPGSTTREVARILKVDTRSIAARLHSYSNPKSTSIQRFKKIMQDGAYRFYPINYKITNGNITRSSGATIPVTIEGTEIYLKRVSPEELRDMERREKRGKYTEIIDALDVISVGEALFIPKDQVSDDGVRSTVRNWFKQTDLPEHKEFKNYTKENYLVVERTV